MVILKQTIKESDRESYNLYGTNVEVLYVGCSNGNLTIWYKSDATIDDIENQVAPTSPVTICVVSAYHERNDLYDMEYIGTAHMPYNEIAYHCFVKYDFGFDI